MYRFKQCREEKGLSQKFVAISLGVKAPSISDWENGKTNPTLENLIGLARLLDVSTDCLLGIETEVKQKSSSSVSEDELDNELLTLIRRLSPEKKKHLVEFLQQK